jgi:hypothetical protein
MIPREPVAEYNRARSREGWPMAVDPGKARKRGPGKGDIGGGAKGTLRVE